MPTLYLTEQGSTLRKEGQRLEVTKSEQLLLSVPALRVEPEPLKRYLQEYEKALNGPFNHPAGSERVTFRRVFALQSHALARALRERGRYEPFCPK